MTSLRSDAETPGENRSWPTDHRGVMANVLSALVDRNDALWSDQ